MRRTTAILACAAIALGAAAQVVSSINQSNMKIPRGSKPAATTATASKAAGTVTVDTANAYYRSVDSAQVCIKAGHWAEAEQHLRSAIKADPANHNNSLLLSNIGTLQRYQGKNEQAIKNYSLALDMTPNAVTIISNRAAAYMAIDSIALSERDYRRVVELDPPNTEARYNLGIIDIQRGDYKAAEDEFMGILKINPNSALAQEGLGKLNEVNGNYTKAIECYSKIIKARPSSQILANRAHCYMMTKQLNNAEDDIRNALQIDSTDGYIYALRAMLNKLRFSEADVQRDTKLALQHGMTEQEVQAMLRSVR